MGKRKDHTGQRFGRLVVSAYVGHDKNGHALWDCACDCGGNKVVRAVHLRTGHTQSCGCIHKEMGTRAAVAASTLPPGQAPKFALLSSYKRSARLRGLTWDLTPEEFFKVIENPCFYCGAPPLVGADRVDNSVGYLKNNLVPCCTICNWMKRHLTIKEFLSHIEQIFKHKVVKALGVGV